MSKTARLDHLLENAVALALGLEQPHPTMSVGPRRARNRPAPRHSAASKPRHERARAAA